MIYHKQLLLTAFNNLKVDFEKAEDVCIISIHI